MKHFKLKVEKPRVARGFSIELGMFEILYKNFLLLCIDQEITVWADPNLFKYKQSDGFWYGNDHISVFRPALTCELSCDKQNIDYFISNKADVEKEFYILLHEYGHWYYKHKPCHEVSPEICLSDEIEAWAKGEELARLLGLVDFNNFYSLRDERLKAYRVGLGKL